MKIGDYVRTDKGEIGKLKELKLDYTKGKRLVTYYTYREVEENFIIFDNTNITQRFVDGSCYYLTDDELKNVEESIIKSSPNIIDLIEVGDILVIKDFVDEACMIFTDIYLIQNEQQLLNIKNDLEKNKNKKLYSIVTKEAFESMEYKIGDE